MKGIFAAIGLALVLLFAVSAFSQTTRTKEFNITRYMQRQMHGDATDQQASGPGVTFLNPWTNSAGAITIISYFNENGQLYKQFIDVKPLMRSTESGDNYDTRFYHSYTITDFHYILNDSTTYQNWQRGWNAIDELGNETTVFLGCFYSDSPDWKGENNYVYFKVIYSNILRSYHLDAHPLAPGEQE